VIGCATRRLRPGSTATDVLRHSAAPPVPTRAPGVCDPGLDAAVGAMWRVAYVIPKAVNALADIV